MPIVVKKRSAGLGKRTTASGRQQGEGGCKRTAAGWAVGVAVLTLSAIVAWWLAGARKRVPPVAGTEAAAPQTVLQGKASSASTAGETPAPPEQPPALEEHASRRAAHVPELWEEPPRRIVPSGRPGYYMLPDGTEFRFRLPPEGQTASLKVRGVLYRFDSEGNFENISKPKVFDNPVENQLVGLSVEGGSFASGLMMRHTDEDILAALNRPVEIHEDDSDEVKAKKEAVAAMKQEILAYMEQGGTYEEFVTEMASMARQERKMKRDGIRKIVSLLDEGRADEARDFYETYNGLLEESGYTPLKLQMGLKERMGMLGEDER